MYEVKVSKTALEELAALRAFDEKRILGAIEEQLSHEPGVATRNRKMLAGVEPSFEAVLPIWELRVGQYRVYYDVSVENRRVYVRAVRYKPSHKTTEETL